LIRTDNYNKYDFRQYPHGTNAVVAVISYTGYDMEDAMIINKGSYERGFAHGAVYKSYIRELNEQVVGGASS
jgi:DNA-directed RNA polymerase I subunit RPA2